MCQSRREIKEKKIEEVKVERKRRETHRHNLREVATTFGLHKSSTSGLDEERCLMILS